MCGIFISRNGTEVKYQFLSQAKAQSALIQSFLPLLVLCEQKIFFLWISRTNFFIHLGDII
jgi:hypothetical protein